MQDCSDVQKEDKNTTVNGESGSGNNNNIDNNKENLD